TIAPVTFCWSSLPLYGVKSRVIVTFGATCLYCSTSVCSEPPWVPGSLPFMPCQNVIVTGAALLAGLLMAVAAFAAAAATVGATVVTVVEGGCAAGAWDG